MPVARILRLSSRRAVYEERVAGRALNQSAKRRSLVPSEEKTYQITFIVTAKEGSEEAHSMLIVGKPIKPETAYPSPVKIISHPIFIAIIILLLISLMIIKRKAIKMVIRGLLEDSYKERLEKKEEEVKEEKLKKEIEEKKKKEEDFKAKLTITIDDLKVKEKEKP